MKRTLIGLLVALLAFTWVAPATAAPLGNPFCKGLKNPAELSSLISESLAKDSTGNTPLDSARCHLKVPATPNDFLAMVQYADPDSGVSRLDQLPAYYRSLVEVKAPQTRYWSACLKPTTRTPSGWRAEANCVARHFRKGEKAWANPKTRKIVYQGDCSNPVGLPEKPDNCVYIYFYTQSGDTTVRLQEFGPQPIKDECTGLKRAGEPDFESPWYDECPNKDCDFRAISAAFHITGWRKGSYGPNPGLHILRLPAYVADRNSPYRVFFCLERNGRVSSNSIGVRWFDYLPQRGTKIATIYYDAMESARARARTMTGESPVLWWHWNESWQPE